MIDAFKFATTFVPGFGKPDYGYIFGLSDPPSLAAALRHLAEDVEAGKMVIISIQSGQVAKPEDFLACGLFIEFAPQVEKK